LVPGSALDEFLGNQVSFCRPLRQTTTFGEVVVGAGWKSFSFQMMGLADHFAKRSRNLAKWWRLAKWSLRKFLVFLKYFLA
jgi:hypothetical protein